MSYIPHAFWIALFFMLAVFCRIAELIIDAYENRKERRALIRQKGFGCESCV